MLHIRPLHKFDDCRRRWHFQDSFITRTLPLCVLVLLAGMLAPLLLAPTTVVAADKPIRLSGTLSPLLVHSHVRGAADPRQVISMAIGLRPHNQGVLNTFVKDVTRPASANYHHYLTPAQFIATFSPDEQDYNALLQFLRSSGFVVTHTYSHRLVIAFTGTIEQAENIFHVAITTFTAPDGHTYYANTNDPLIPAQFANVIQSISGLNDAARWRHPPTTIHKLAGQSRPASIPCPSPGTGHLTADQIAAAYNINGLYQAGYQGDGQTIALFELDNFVMSDILAYTSCFGHSHTPISTIFTGSAAVPSDEGMLEVELDTELVLSAAPRLGALKIYQAANDPADYLAEWAQIVQDAVPFISTSWGLCEEYMGFETAQQEYLLFTAAASQGQSIFAASGDSGSAGCAFDGSDPVGLNADDPSTQPYVTGVGGTSLALNGSAYGSETVWNNAPGQSMFTRGGATGGGISEFWPAPAWQNAPGVRNSYSSGIPCSAPAGTLCREAPDVALHADPYNGYLMYCTPSIASCDSMQPWISVAGTSAAAPMWAAVMALTNQMLLKQGGFNLGFVNPLLYQLASDPVRYHACFHDIVTGHNDYNYQHNGSYPATAGYDLATGLGSYNAAALATNLVALALQTRGQRSSPTSTIWYFAEGSVGGGFQEYITLQNPSSTLDASVNITYLFQNRPALTIGHLVNRSSRFTVSANADLGIPTTAVQQAISAIVRVVNGPGIVAERPMYFNYKGIQSGTDAVGATHPGTSYYFPLVDTRRDSSRIYYTYLTMLNPNAQAANVTLTYFTGNCGSGGRVCPTQTLTLPSLQRGTATPMALSLFQRMAVSVQANLPIVVERPAYFKDIIPNAGGLTTGAASLIGASSPGNNWLFAEGYTGNNFQEYLVLANYTSTATIASILLAYSNGHRQVLQVTVPALGQFYLDVNAVNSHPIGTCDTTPCQTTTTASMDVSTVAPVVADRLMYFHFGRGGFSGSTETVGEAGPAAHNVYAFAEGYTANTFQEYLTLYNPTPNDETIAITFLVNTYIIQQQVTVRAYVRRTIDVNALVVPVVQNALHLGADSYAVSITVQALGGNAKVVAERVLYFNYYGDQGGTDAIGYTG